jgi:uroporphyrinogen decarboxylase
MNNRERVLAALEHRQPDKTPYHIGFTQVAHARMADYYGDPRFEEKLGNCLTITWCEPAGSWREVAPDVWEDQFGVRWNRSVDKDIGVVCNRVVAPDTLAALRLPDPDDPTRYAHLPGLAAAGGDRYLVVELGFSHFERAWTLAGMENVLMWMVEDKPLAHALLDRIVEFNLQVIARVCARECVDAMLFGDDWGQQRGVIMGPKLWREFLKPRVRQMYDAVRRSGKRVFIHSCGKVDELFPDLIECGVSVFNPFQPEVIDVVDVKRKYGRELSFFGGISTQRTLPYGTPQETRDEVRRLIDQVGRDGGYIASPAHAIPADAKPENIAAMIEVLRGQ